MPPKTDNRSVGGRFEQELAQKLADAGFWVHVLQQNKAGQPADIICSKGSYTTLIDCKVISNDAGFPLRRVEENQQHAMKLFESRTKRPCWFAVKLPDGDIHLISSTFLFDMIGSNHTSISEKFIREYTYGFDEWLKEANERTFLPDENNDF